MPLHVNSLASYDAVKPALGRRHAEVLAVLEAAPLGLTGEEIAQRIGRHPYVVRPRLTELAADDKQLVIDTGTKRLNSHGKHETVWKRWTPALVQPELWT